MDKDKSLGINDPSWQALVDFALKPDPFWEKRPPAKPLTRRQKVGRFIRRIKHSFFQKIHDWTERKGADCRETW